MTQTVGQYRVGSTFNPSGNPDVDALKTKAAAFIDECAQQLRAADHDANLSAALHMEKKVLYERAMREAESAAMWAVKAATKRVRE